MRKIVTLVLATVVMVGCAHKPASHRSVSGHAVHHSSHGKLHGKLGS